MERRGDSRNLRTKDVRDVVRDAGSVGIREERLEIATGKDHRAGTGPAIGVRARIRAGAKSRGCEAVARTVAAFECSEQQCFVFQRCLGVRYADIRVRLPNV